MGEPKSALSKKTKESETRREERAGGLSDLRVPRTNQVPGSSGWTSLDEILGQQWQQSRAGLRRGGG
jgi:hypothetical protein